MTFLITFFWDVLDQIMSIDEGEFQHETESGWNRL